MSIFKAYDIRGIYPNELNEEITYKIGRAFVQFLNAKEVVIGYDMRESSKSLRDALVKGITDQAADVIDIGLCSTPMLYFAARNKEAAIMITASHNPKEYNGLKLCKANAMALSNETGITEIENIVKATTKTGKLSPKVTAAKPGKVVKKDITKEYIKHILKFASGITSLKIVFDFGNGMGGYEVPSIVNNLGAKCVNPIYLFKELDGSFPNHEPNPIKPENLTHLSAAVLQNKADLGIATDGDADRIGIVDEKGRMIPGDILLALLAEEMLKENPEEKVLYEIRSSWALKETIESSGGVPVMWRAGHSFLKEKMKQDDILLGGEKSGHYFFRDNFYVESPMLVALTLMRLLTAAKKEGKTVSKLVEPLMKYANSGEINFEVQDKDRKIADIEKVYANDKQKPKVEHIDGLTVEFKDWWFNLRKSNTEPVIRLNLEAKSEALMKEKLREITRYIQR